VGLTGSAVGVGDTAAGGKVSAGVTEACGCGVGVDVGTQAVKRRAARISTLI
jgi:hypothetical protein